jgi:hypothetical protein
MGGIIMIFKDSTQYDSYYFPFNWGAEYFDGTYLTEFDLQNYTKNDFYSIEQNKINRFGVYGCGMKFYYNVDGSFNLNGQRIEVELHLNDKIYNLTSSSSQKDCITYKNKQMWFHSDFSVQSDEMVSIDFGYKTLLNYDGIQFFFQPIVKLPVNQERGKVEIEMKITSNIEGIGKIVIKNKHGAVDSEECPLELNRSTVIDWIVH